MTVQKACVKIVVIGVYETQTIEQLVLLYVLVSSRLSVRTQTSSPKQRGCPIVPSSIVINNGHKRNQSEVVQVVQATIKYHISICYDAKCNIQRRQQGHY